MIKIYDSKYRGVCDVEDQDQINFTSWFCYQYPKYATLYFHVVNESSMPVQGRVKAKKKGLKAGVSDIIILLKRGEYSGLIIELKRKDKSKSPVRKEQKWFLDEVGQQQFFTAICYGFEEAQKCVREYILIN
jgi:hypothetical protein|tara:strand:- start:1413 stop:1808 length:396 start_codon:yes stop_codon:yes gene_type:complete